MYSYSIESWLDSDILDNIEYSEYWNDELVEKNKEFYILNGNFSKMEHYLKESGLLNDLYHCIGILKRDYNLKLHGNGIDLAAGVLWAVPHLLELGKIEKLLCLEYSKHRLEIGKKVLGYYGINHDKVGLIYGSFYDIRLENSSMDFVLLSAAFHHASDTNRLLSEVSRILKPGGVVIIIGEHCFSLLREYFKYFIKLIIAKLLSKKMQLRIFNNTFNEGKWLPKISDVFPVDAVAGDHYYSNLQYNEMFSKYNFKFKQIKNPDSKFQSFILLRP